MNKKLFIIFCLVFVGIFIGSDVPQTKHFLRLIDWQFLNGIFSRLQHYEPSLESSAMNLTDAEYNYGWLDSNADVSSFLVIRHRGGNYKKYGQNTVRVIDDSLAAGYRLIELDFILENEEIVCATDERFKAQRCDLDNIFERFESHDFWLVVDIKDEKVRDPLVFEKYLEIFFTYPKFVKYKDRFIFQVYNLAHLDVLTEFPIETGPIFTTYNTTVPISIIRDQLRHHGVRAVTTPINALRFIPKGITQDFLLFTHPVSGRKTMEGLFEDFGVNGFYCSELCK